MARRVVLSKDSMLWEEGDASRTIAILEKGKLGVKVDDQLIGIVWPKMVIGESAILTGDSREQKASQRRTASVYAWEDDTTVSEYPAALVRRTFEEGNTGAIHAILTSLVGQICRNCLMIVSAHQNKPLTALPFKGMMDELLKSFREHLVRIKLWDDFLNAFTVLYGMRDATDQMREQLVLSQDGEVIEHASKLFKDLYKADEAHRGVEDYLDAEHEKLTWLSTFQRHGAHS